MNKNSNGKHKNDKTAVEPLIAALKDADADVVENAAAALGHLGDPRALVPLMDTKHTGKWNARDAAAGALKKLQKHFKKIYLETGRGKINMLVSKLYAWRGSFRRRILKALGETGDTEAVPYLVHALTHGNKRARAAAVEALGRIGGPAVDALVPAAGDRHPAVREKVLNILGKLGDNRAVLPLLHMQKELDPGIRKWSQDALDRMGHRAVDPLIHALKDDDYVIRTAAVKRLRRFRESRVVDALHGALEDTFFETRGEAVKALAAIGDKRSVEPLVKALKDASPEVRAETVKTLAYMKDGRGLRAMVPVLADSDPGVRETSARAIWTAGEDALPYLADALKNDSLEVREAVVAYCGRHVEEPMAKPLMGILKDSPPELRVKIIKVLGNYMHMVLVEPLLDTLADADVKVLEAAAEALGNLGDERAVEPLIHLLKGRDLLVRAKAAWALGKIGDKRALEELFHLLGDMKKSWIVDERWHAQREVVIAMGRLHDARAVEPLIRFAEISDPEALKILEMLRYKLPAREQGFVCQTCFLRAEEHKQKLTLATAILNTTGRTFSYYACRGCHTNAYLLEGVKTVVLLLDRQFEAEFVREGDVLLVNGFKREELFDYDQIHIRGADDYDVEKLVMRLKNDGDDMRRKRLPEIPVYLPPGLNLSPARLNMLRDNFKVSRE